MGSVPYTNQKHDTKRKTYISAIAESLKKTKKREEEKRNRKKEIKERTQRSKQNYWTGATDEYKREVTG